MGTRKEGTNPESGAWAASKAPVGLRLLQKMGWKDGKGLGANEDGRISHIKVTRKISGLGVGGTAADLVKGWDAPREVAEGLNDVLGRLAAVAATPPPDDKASNDKTKSPETGDLAVNQKAKKETLATKRTSRAARGGRGFYERRRALKSVGQYSKQQLAEIFGSAGEQTGATLQPVSSVEAGTMPKELSREPSETSDVEEVASGDSNVAEGMEEDELSAKLVRGGLGSMTQKKSTRNKKLPGLKGISKVEKRKKKKTKKEKEKSNIDKKGMKGINWVTG